MKRKNVRHRQRNEEDDPGVDISSLVDVSFLLLIYFLVVATIQKKEQDLDMTLPEPSRSKVKGAPLVVKLEEDGEIIANPIDYPELISPAGGSSALEPLAERLRLLKAAQGGAASVVLHVSQKVDYQRFIDVINCLAGEEIQQLALVDLLDHQ